MRWGRALLCGAFVVASIPLMGRPAAGACGLPGAPTATVYLPNITKTLGGPTGWVTPFIVQNVGSSVTTLEVSFYDFVSGALVTCRQVVGLAPQTSFADIPNSDSDLPDGSAFSVVVRSFGSQVVAVVNEHQGEGPRAEALSYVGLSSGATRVGLPWVARADGGWLTTFIVQNLGMARASVAAAFVSEDGTKTATLAAAIEPGRSWAVNPANEPALLDGTSYAVLLTSDQPVGVVANAHNDGPTALQPMAFSYNGAPAETGETQVPWVARNADGGRTTTVVMQNLGSSAAQPTLTFRRIGGTEQAVVQLGIVEPGRAARYTLPAASPACPVGGTEACPREGEHALAVSGGSFGVLAYSLGQAAAMGGTGSTTSSARVYLPNITKTLGGVAGWTTPIVIQSAGATTAFLRWYRFADGQLAITQYLGGLEPGRSVRIDPRDLGELTDGTQYSVVVDGSGPLRAAVLELSSSGGDGAMAYEGFASSAPATPLPTVTSISLQPVSAALIFGRTLQLVVTVRDQAGNAVTGVPLTWTVEPSALGTITGGGLFTAGGVAGTATVRATGLGLSAAASLSIAAETQTIGSQTFTLFRTASADVYSEQTITSADAQTVVALVEPAVAYVQGAFARSFADRPAIYVFPNEASATAGYYTVLGGLGSPPTNYRGFFVPASGRIALDWAGIESELPYSTLRHELVHKMEYQITRRAAAQVPAWVVEGLAAMHDLTEPGSGYATAWTRYTTASTAAASGLFATTLSDDAFRALRGLDTNVAYAESAETVRLLQSDLGVAGMIRLLEEVGTGKDFATAYAVVSGRTVASFLAEKDARLRALAPSYPGVVATTDTVAGPGLAYVGYGFPADSLITVTISGGGYVPTVVTRTTNAYGVVTSYLSGGWRPSTYTFTLTYGGVSVSIAAAKAASVDASALMTDATRLVRDAEMIRWAD